MSGVPVPLVSSVKTRAAWRDSPSKTPTGRETATAAREFKPASFSHLHRALSRRSVDRHAADGAHLLLRANLISTHGSYPFVCLESVVHQASTPADEPMSFVRITH
jgi:hypothetical protein